METKTGHLEIEPGNEGRIRFNLMYNNGEICQKEVSAQALLNLVFRNHLRRQRNIYDSIVEVKLCNMYGTHNV